MKQLLIQGDDLGMSPSINKATFRALLKGLLTTASVMVPCPYFQEVIQFKKEHPQVDLSLHLTLTCEWTHSHCQRWGPVAPLDLVPSLVDSQGFFWPHLSQVISRAQAEEVERELEAQIQLALSHKIHPIHLNSHMYALWQHPPFLAIYKKLIKKYQCSHYLLPDREGDHQAAYQFHPSSDQLRS